MIKNFYIKFILKSFFRPVIVLFYQYALPSIYAGTKNKNDEFYPIENYKKEQSLKSYNHFKKHFLDICLRSVLKRKHILKHFFQTHILKGVKKKTFLKSATLCRSGVLAIQCREEKKSLRHCRTFLCFTQICITHCII